MEKIVLMNDIAHNRVEAKAGSKFKAEILNQRAWITVDGVKIRLNPCQFKYTKPDEET